MNLLTHWNNDAVLVIVLLTGALTIACVAATLLRRSAALKNSILLPTLVITFAIPLTLIGARTSGWAISVPLLSTSTPTTTTTTLPTSPAPARAANDTTTPARQPSVTDQTAPAIASADEPIASATPRASAGLSIGMWLLLIWVAGSLFCLFRLGRSYVVLRRVLNTARPGTNPRVTAAAAEVGSTLGLATDPSIAVTTRVQAPMAFGTPRRGWVICPPNALEQMPQEQLLHVLMHEGAHIAHRDSSLRLIQALAGALWWWHPLVHLLNRQLGRTREELCDNVVLSAADPVEYSQTLLEVGRNPIFQHPPALAAGLFPEHEHLEQRIRSLLNPRRNIMDRSRPSVLVLACLVGVSASALAGATRVTSAPAGPAAPAGTLWTNNAQRTLAQEFTLSFEDPTTPGHLDIDIKRGDILVSGYSGDEVLVRLSVPNDSPAITIDARDGLQTISARPLDFNVRQNGNTIELDGNSYEYITHIEVLVPNRIDLTLDSYRTGVIRVTNIDGHVNARSQNNDIYLTGIRGTADLYGYNGSFIASFLELTGDLEVETYNGNINLSLPADTQATTYIRADQQDVKSEFTIIERPAELMVTEHPDGSRSMAFSDYTIGDINGGGARAQIETTNGSVRIRAR